MQSAHASVLNTLGRIQRFLDANTDVLGTINHSKYRTILDDVVATLDGHVLSQTTSKRAGAAATAKGRVLRDALEHDHLRPISTIAAAELEQVPEFLSLEMPAAHSSSRALITAAAAMGMAAARYSSVFI